MLELVRRIFNVLCFSDFLWITIFLGLIFNGCIVEGNEIEITCGDPAVPLNARIILSNKNLKSGTKATYVCDEGYELFGDNTLECSSSGKWLGEIPFCGTNVAFRKPANQSTTVRGGPAINANDGDNTVVHDGKRCTETQKEVSPWWTVDLLKSYSVKVVRVTTRGCCGHQPLQDLEIRVGNSSTDLQRNPLCAWFPGTVDEGTTKTFTCARPLIGQFVFLQLVGVEGSLSLCEVEVFSMDELSNERCTPSNAPEDAQISSFLHTCYEFGVNRGGSFKDARESCISHSGDLIHEFSGPTARFLFTELDRRKPTMKTQLVWIGAQKEPGITARTWKWVNGNLIAHPTWGKDQPNNYNGEQNCVVLDGGRNWQWNDVGCNLDYLHWICQHKPPICGSPNKELNTTIIGTNHTIGSTIEYVCPVGQLLVGTSKRICQSDGFWSENAPTCKYIDCGEVNEIEHGTILYMDQRTTYNAIVQYKCHENYTLIGNDKRKCNSEGVWADSVPKCLFGWCPEPPSINGGTVSINGHHVGAIANYTCDSGFILFGTPTLTCELGGKWSNKPPTCKYIDCGSPPNISNGRYALLNGTTTYNSFVQYTCQEDYWLDGKQTQVCTRDGIWSSTTPSCELITCDEPEVPAGSYVVGYDFNVHSTIEYNCELGHILIGEPNHICTQNGEWSGNTPVCKYIECGKVPPLLYGYANYTNGTTYLHSEVQYSCVNNYRLNGVNKRICLENGQWSHESPKCEEIRCPEPILAEHSILSVTGNDRMYGRTLIRKLDSTNVGATSYKIGALVKYRCERGYKIVGDPLSTCEENGLWSGTIPQCIFVDCKNPDKIEHGKFNLASNVTYYGSTVLYECDPNYELDGISRRLCLENGTWSSETPKCQEILCQDPDTIGLATFEVSTHSIGGIAHYSCPKGNNMAGNSTRICLKRGTWSGTPPICTPVDCKDPGVIENGRVIIMNGTTYNSAIEYHCIPHYDRIGPYLRKCMDTGIWSGEEPKCLLATSEMQDSSGLGMTIGIGCGIVLFLLLMLAIIYLRLRKATPIKNTENIEGVERKEEQNAAVMSYATLNGNRRYTHSSLGSNIYDNINEDNVYDAPYEETGRENSTYEPEPIGRLNGNVITINGVAVR